MSAPLAAPTPSAPDGAPDAATRFELDGLVYALDRPPRRQGRRSVATVRPAEHADDPGFTDRVDLYAYRSRAPSRRGWPRPSAARRATSSATSP